MTILFFIYMSAGIVFLVIWAASVVTSLEHQLFEIYSIKSGFVPGFTVHSCLKKVVAMVKSLKKHSFLGVKLSARRKCF